MTCCRTTFPAERCSSKIRSMTSGVQLPYQIPSGSTPRIGPPLQMSRQPALTRITVSGRSFRQRLQRDFKCFQASSMSLEEQHFAVLRSTHITRVNADRSNPSLDAFFWVCFSLEVSDDVSPITRLG